MRYRRQLATALLPVMLLATLAAVPSAEAASKPSVSSWRAKLSSASRNIQYLQQKLRPIKQRQKVAERDLWYAKKRLGITQRNLRDIRGQLYSTQHKLSETMSTLRVIEGRLQERNNLLAERLVDSYKYGGVSYVGVMCGAADFWDLLNGAHIVGKIVQHDVELIDSIKEDKRAVERHKAVLEEQRRKRAELEREQRVLTAQAASQTKEANQILATTNRQRAELEQRLAEELAASRRISAMIRQMQRTPAGRKRSATPWHGSFAMPVAGRITSPYGMRRHPIRGYYRQHTGVDIAAPSGTPIRAAASGVVVLSGWNGSVYGNTVMIDHGGGMFTFYGHCSRVAARVGQSVKRGQTVAYVGSTGLSTGPHVHFEVQRNGVPVNPHGNY